MEKEGRTPYGDEPKAAAREFRGYAPPTSSTTYTPNQLFDVVLPNASRGCLRLVAYLVRRTLGWSDAEGNPQNPQAQVSYREFIESAGISRGALKGAIDEAVAKRYIDCLRFGQSHRPGEEGYSALYSLRWDSREEYVTDPEEFDGFFAGNGNLTHIPNDFFDYTIPNEPLGVVRVVGVIIRHTIGWQTRFGMRRQQVPMSFNEIMRRTGIRSRTTVSEALKAAIAGRHLRKVSEGVFDPVAGTAATYAIQWADQAENEPEEPIGSKTGPGSPQVKRSKNWTSDLKTVQKLDQADGSENGPGEGPKTGPGTVQNPDQLRFKKRTTIETTNLNNTPKQQQTGPAAVGPGSLSLLAEELMRLGVSSEKSRDLVRRYPEERIRRQMKWLPHRRVTRSPTGMLIRAIEQDLPDPRGAPVAPSEPAALASHFYAEMAGNAGDPAASPSAADVEAAERLGRRLAGEPEAIGRGFARFVRASDQGSRSPVRTLPLASRLYGDAFVAAQEASRREIEARRGAEARAEEDRRVQAEYKAFVAETVERLERTDTEIREGFLAFSEQRLTSRAKMSERAAQMYRSQLEDPVGRLELLAEYVAQKHPGIVPGLEEWRRVYRDAIMEEERG